MQTLQLTPPSVERSPEAWAEFYQRVGSPAPCAVAFAERVKARGGSRLLDLGCGTGRNLPPFLETGFSIEAVDINPEALIRARMLAPHARGLRISDMRYLAFPDSSFDAVMAVSVMNHGLLADVRAAFHQVHRVLRKDGQFLVTMITPDHVTYGKGVEIEPDTFVSDEGVDPGVPHHFFTIGRFAAFMEEVGFRIERLQRAGVAEIAGINDGHLLALATP